MPAGNEYRGWLKADFMKEVKRLQELNNEQKNELDKLWQEMEDVHKLKAEIQKLKNEQSLEVLEACPVPVKNARGAGRKAKLNEERIADIKRYRESGMTYRAIAERMGLSLGLVNRAGRQFCS